MANKKTVKPAGGGDFTTLQLWEDFADGEATADQEAECFTGGDLGALDISGWTSTPTASVFPRVFVAEGEGHGGDKTQGAFTSGIIAAGVFFTRIEGMRGNVFRNGSAQAAQNVQFISCLSHDVVGNAFVVSVTGGSDDIETTLKNCISLDCSGVGFFAGGSAMNGATITSTLYNCLSYGSGGNGFQLKNSKNTTGGGIVLIENCIGMANGGTDFVTVDTGGDGSLTMNNCLSSDDSADDFGGTGHLISQTDTDVFRDPTGDDFNLAASSPAINAGKTIAAVTDDIIGILRPQGLAYDMGIFEMIGSLEISFPISNSISFAISFKITEV